MTTMQVLLRNDFIAGGTLFQNTFITVKWRNSLQNDEACRGADIATGW